MSQGTANARVTQQSARMMTQKDLSIIRRNVTQMTARAMSQLGSPGVRCTEVYARIMIPFAPNFEWIDMIIDEVFPFDISYNSIGATRFQTDVVRVDSGHDQRASRWSQPLMEYDVAYGVRTLEQLHALIAFFRVMKGRKYAFLYQDIVDHTSNLAVNVEARTTPEITATDQQIGIGDSSTYTFQLTKTYPSPSGQNTQVRPIYRPQPGTVMIAVDGQEVTNWSVDNTTGIVTFSSPWGKTGLNGMTLTMPTDSDPPHFTISGPARTFTGGIAVGNKIVTTGWLNPINNTTLSLSLVVTEIGSDGSYIKFTAPSSYGQAESNRNGVSIYVHPAPATGAVITAGYLYYVPVRFDTDRLPVTLEWYGIGGAADVKLVEVRPASEGNVP